MTIHDGQHAHPAGTVATLRVAPVKGLATITREQIRLDDHGVAEDRRLFMLDADGTVVTLRTHPELVRVVPDLDLDQQTIRITMPDGTLLSSPLQGAAEPVRAHLFGKDREGKVLPGDVADALSTVARAPLRLVVADRTGVGWDEGPVSLIGRASAMAVGGPDRDPARYRMLIEVDGTRPFEEDTWVGRRLEIGSARLHVTHQLVRCVVITRSPATGAQDWDGLRALAEQGRRQLCLGVIADVAVPGTIRVGDLVRVTG